MKNWALTNLSGQYQPSEDFKPGFIEKLIHWLDEFSFHFLMKHISGAPNENVVQNHLNIALLNVF